MTSTRSDFIDDTADIITERVYTNGGGDRGVHIPDTGPVFNELPDTGHIFLVSPAPASNPKKFH